MKKSYHKNPRVITNERLMAIRDNIKELGDLSGITVDLNTNEIITGNQRSSIININDCEVVYTKKLKKPDEQGTVAYGYIVWEGQYMNYREVRWNDEQREKANITANALSGEFSHKLLADFAQADLRQWGIRSEILQKIVDQNKEEELASGLTKYPIVPKMSEKYSYVIVVAMNEIDLAFLETFFELRREKSYKNNKVGIGRVVSFERFKEIIKKHEGTR